MRHLHLPFVPLLLLATVASCAAPAVAPSAAAPTLPTSASVGGANIVAISPPAQQCCPKQTLPQFLGITGACEGIKELINRLRNRLRIARQHDHFDMLIMQLSNSGLGFRTNCVCHRKGGNRGLRC